MLVSLLSLFTARENEICNCKTSFFFIMTIFFPYFGENKTVNTSLLALPVSLEGFLKDMGDAQSLPVIGETVTVIESGTKLVAAGGCALVGKTDAAEKLLDGAGNSWKEYSEKNVVAAGVQCAYHGIIKGDDAEANRIAEKSVKALEGVADGLPVVGHVKGVYHYATGDEEHGDRCMNGATRTTLVLGAGAVTGGLGAGAVAGGLVGVEAGLVYDGVSSVVKDEPVGCAKTLDQAFKTDDPNNAVDFGLGLAGDFAGGYSGAQMGEAIRVKSEQNALKNSYKKLKQTGKMPQDFDPHQATSDTIQAARNLDRHVRNGDVRGDAHVSSRVRNLETNEVSQGYSSRARSNINVAEFERHGTDSGFNSRTNARRSAVRNTSELIERNPGAEQVLERRHPARCAEHDAFNHYYEAPGANAANAQVVSVQYLDGVYNTVMRCPNCFEYAMGRVPTDLVSGQYVPVASVSGHVISACKCGLLCPIRGTESKTKRA